MSSCAQTRTDPPSRLLIDVTRTLESGLHTGIQRVVRGLYRGARASGAAHGFNVRAVRYRGDQWFDVGPLPPHELEASGAAYPSLSVCSEGLAPTLLRPQATDVLLLADASWYGQPWPAVDALRHAGGQVVGFVHDLLPLEEPTWFRCGVGARFGQHLEALQRRATQLFTASEHVRGQLEARAAGHAIVKCLPPAGELPHPVHPMPLPAAAHTPWFLCVATLEPRKQHGLLLDAMEAYWADGGEAGLLLVGAPGWCNDALLERVRNHPQQGQRLHWLDAVNDTELAALYRAARALVYLSRSEGFGLPVLEAREAGCPVIASDIPPLREAGGPWPRFVDPAWPGALIAALHDPPVEGSEGSRPGRTWERVGADLLSAVTGVSTDYPYNRLPL